MKQQIEELISDISKEKETEDRLSIYQNLLSSTLEALDSLIMVIDRNHRIVLSNWKDHEWVPEEERDKRPYCYKALKNFDSPCEHCPPIETFKDGKYRWYEDQNPMDGSFKEISVTPIFNEKETVEYVVENVRDVTERKKKEEYLEFDSLLLDNVTDSIFVHDLEGNFVYVNKAAYRDRGYTKDELMSMNLKELDPPEYAQQIKPRIADLLDNGRAVFESAHYRKDGSIMPIELHSHVIRIENRKLVLSVARDITKSKKAERELRESKEWVTKTLNYLPAGVVIVDAETHEIFDVNPKAEEMIGLPKKDIVGKICHNFICPHEAGNCPVKNSDQDIDNAERVLLNARGEELPILKNVTSINFNDNNFLIESFVDIAERKKMEENLKMKDSAMESSINAIAISDLDGNLTYVNSSFIEMWGYETSQEIIGEKAVKFWRNEEEAREVIYALKEKGEYFGELKGTKKDGTEFDVQLSASIVRDVNENPQGYMASFVDITDRKNMENKVIQMNEILRLLNKTLRHDILNDLTVVDNSIEMYEELGDDKLLKNATKSIENSIKLIKQIRELEPLVSTGDNLKTYDAKDVIMESVGNYPQVEVHGNCSIMADNALYSVFENLVKNAVNHGKADKIDIIVEERGGFCEIRVADNGTGISDQFKEKVFKEGFSEGKGTGLGLYIARKTIERYGGTIHVKDNQPEGAVFVLSLKVPQKSEVQQNEE